MTDILRQILAGPTVSKDDPAYRAYQDALRLAARIKSAIWLVRTHPDSNLRTALREVRREVGRRASATADGFGPSCSRMEPSVGQAELAALASRHADPLDQARALVAGMLADLAPEDAAAQSLAVQLLTLAGSR